MTILIFSSKVSAAYEGSALTASIISASPATPSSRALRFVSGSTIS